MFSFKAPVSPATFQRPRSRATVVSWAQRMRQSMLLALACATSLISPIPVNAAESSRDGSIIARWKGTYTCAQGLTGITLTITQASPGNASALFHFYADSRNPGVPTGCFSMSGSYDAGRGALRLEGRDWILRPSGYLTVNFSGLVDALGSRFSGVVEGGPACTTFDLTRTDESVSNAGPCHVDLPVQASDISAGAMATALEEVGHVDLDIRFAFDEARILQDAGSQLDELGRLMTTPQYYHRRFALNGHTDGKGSDSYNQKLSMARALAVADYLSRHFGVTDDRLQVSGFGATRLRVPEQPFDERNRRVEIVLLDE